MSMKNTVALNLTIKGEERGPRGVSRLSARERNLNLRGKGS